MLLARNDVYLVRIERPCSSGLGVYRWRVKLDPIQQAPAKHGQDWTYLVCDFEAISPTSVYFNQGWIRKPYRHQPHSAISMSTSTVACQCDLTFSWRSCAAWLHFGRSEVFVGLCHPPRWRTWVVVSLVLTRLDYGNVTLAGMPSSLLRRLQAVMNASARTITGLQRSAHITMSLAGLHWLRAAERIKFKLATLTIYRCLHCAAPTTCPLN